LGLYLALYRHRFGVQIPDPACSMEMAVRREVANDMRPYFQRVTAAREGDALMFRVRGQLLHVGYALNGRDMLHIERASIGSNVEVWNRSPWTGRLEGIYRFVG
jgi:cell wall-associated NlpC family hydrolase